MHYYKFNIADWNLSTSHLTIEEESIYFRLINHYYNTEKPIPIETQPVFRRLRLDSAPDTASSILSEFFTLTDNGWIHDRCDKELKEYKKKAKVNKANGAKGGRPKAGAPSKETQNKPKRLASEKQIKSENNPNQEPRTINHKPRTKNQETIKDNNSKAEQAPVFMFKKALIDLDVDEKLALEWLAVRRKKKASNTETAFKGFLSQVKKAGLTVGEAVQISVENSWSGFKAEWLESGLSKSSQGYDGSFIHTTEFN